MMLPSPAEQPQSDVVIYDGECRFCSTNVERIARWDGKRRLSFLSLHDPLVATKYADLTHERLMDEIVIVDQQGVRHGGYRALQYLTRRLPRLWPLAPLMHLPYSGQLWNRLYRWVARRRYRLSGGSCENDACSLR